MVKLLDRVKMTVSGTPGTGNITLNAAEAGFQTFAQAGAVDTDVVRYAVTDGTGFEIGTAVLSSSATVMTRTVDQSSNSNNALNLTSNAVVFATLSAADLSANPAPRWTTEPVSTLSLAIDGSTAVTLTGVAVDEAGFPVRYSWDGYNGNGSTIYDAENLPPQLASAPVINQTTGVTSLVGSSTSSNAGTYYHRSRATDGINTLWSTTAINLVFFSFTTAFTKTGASNGDQFGFCTATNGTYAAAGAPKRPLSGTSSFNGAVYVYNVSDGSGLSNFSPLTTTAGDLYFGGAVAMSDTLLAVSSLPDTTTANKVRLYTFTSNTPVLTLSSSSTSTTDKFGQSIALSGNYLLISDIGNSAVKVYAANDFGSYSRGDLIRTWTQGTAGTDTFGNVVRAHGDVAIITNRQYNPSSGANTGRAHRYSLASGNEVTSGVWPITGNAASSFFGIAAALNGTYAAINQIRTPDGTTSNNCTVVNLSTNAITNTIYAAHRYTALASDHVILGDGFDNTQTGKVTAYDIQTGAAYNPTGWPLTGTAANDYFGSQLSLANCRGDGFSQADGVVLLGSEQYSGGASSGRMLIVK